MKKAALKETITKKPSHKEPSNKDGVHKDGHKDSGVPALTTVRFLVRDAPFVAGQEVVFPRATAERLIASGVAEAVGRGEESDGEA